MKIAMFVFNAGNGDRRLHRQASLLGGHGHQVRVYCFRSPPESHQHLWETFLFLHRYARDAGQYDKVVRFSDRD